MAVYVLTYTTGLFGHSALIITKKLENDQLVDGLTCISWMPGGYENIWGQIASPATLATDVLVNEGDNGEMKNYPLLGERHVGYEPNAPASMSYDELDYGRDKAIEFLERGRQSLAPEYPRQQADPKSKPQISISPGFTDLDIGQVFDWVMDDTTKRETFLGYNAREWVDGNLRASVADKPIYRDHPLKRRERRVQFPTHVVNIPTTVDDLRKHTTVKDQNYRQFYGLDQFSMLAWWESFKQATCNGINARYVLGMAGQGNFNCTGVVMRALRAGNADAFVKFPRTLVGLYPTGVNKYATDINGVLKTQWQAFDKAKAEYKTRAEYGSNVETNAHRHERNKNKGVTFASAEAAIRKEATRGVDFGLAVDAFNLKSSDRLPTKEEWIKVSDANIRRGFFYNNRGEEAAAIDRILEQRVPNDDFAAIKDKVLEIRACIWKYFHVKPRGDRTEAMLMLATHCERLIINKAKEKADADAAAALKATSRP
ncbi:MAG: hypothetical protein WCN98_15570 [Verrucomicrobiaceae bacterium]